MIPRLTAPTVEELRLIRPASLKLWRALIRRRDRAGLGSGEWFTACLSDVARYARIAYPTAKASLGELRNAGLVATSRCAQSRWFRCRSTSRLTTGNALEENLYLVLGSLRSRYGVDHIEFPDAWRTFVERGRARAWRVPVSNVVGHPLSKGCAELDAEAHTSVTYKRTNASQPETSEKAAAAYSPGFISEELRAIITCTSDEDTESLDKLGVSSGGMVRLGGLGRVLKPLGDLRDCPRLPPDQYPRAAPLVTYISPEQIPELKARQVVDGYRRAVMEVYGTEWWQYSKGDLKKSRFYDRLLRCGEEMGEHSVPPDHWAIWRLRWFKEKIGRFRNQPPPIFVVMSGKSVRERAGWFRNEYQLPVPVLQIDPVIYEQHLRNQEAARLWAGHTGEGVWLMQSFPRWYVDKRREEIASGITSPHDMWPTKPGSKYGRIRGGQL